MLNYFPKYFTSKAISLYLGILILITVMFYTYSMKWYWIVFGLIEVISFFYFSNELTKKWQVLSEKAFVKRLFGVALVIRVVWVIFSYFFYNAMTGQPFEFSAADSLSYNDMGNWVAYLIKEQGTLAPFFNYFESAYSDSGYIFYLGIIYTIFGQNLIIVRLLKALISAFTCVLIYRLAERNFGKPTARMAAIFCMLMPNLIYYCGLHLKETEMVFLTVAFVERADYAIRGIKFTFINLLVPVLLASSLFLFRTVLGAAALFSFITALVFVPGRTLKGWKRMILVAWVSLAVLYFLGGRIATEIETTWEGRQTNQAESMEWRSQRKGGNSYAKYMSGVVFAPMIFTIPFPTMVDIPIQQNQQLIHGGNYVKNIMAFFILVAIFYVVRNKKWREYALVGSFVVAYLLIIAMSAFAQSERFHQPVLPFELMIAAYGISVVTNKTKKYYMIYLAFIFVAICAWSWFKLSGRGLV